ncbi:MAG: DUF6308 family protein [Ornithinimicrobium sp.]
MHAYEGIWLTPSLTHGSETRAVTVLRAYFDPEIRSGRGFTGGSWDTFDPAGTREESAHNFTPDDLVACSLLGTPIGGFAALELLKPHSYLWDQLAAIDLEKDFAQLTSTDADEFKQVRKLFRSLRDLPDVGETRATKLLARKRPRLVPIVDSVITTHIFHNANTHWQPLHESVTANDKQLWKHLQSLHQWAGLDPAVSTLRVFDVLAWMDGTGHSDTVLAMAPRNPNEPH